jgi:wyosine [tRNA(Phe)-imidazoG37] synthetase (radical SAM superfamily)
MILAPRYVFGPVQSRRLGRSLGVDPLPLKTCNWNCVYCQLGRTVAFTHERGDFCPPADVVAEVAAALARLGTGAVDWVTFGGSGEPTLHRGLGRMVRDVKDRGVPVAVLTNGSLLHDEEVQADLLAADAVLTKLDAGSAAAFRRIARPSPRLTFEGHLQGLRSFRERYAGFLGVEVMLLRGVNDDLETQRDIAALLRAVGPDAVDVTRPVRPTAERVQAGEGAVSPVPRPARDLGSLEAALAVIDRHPLADDELEPALREAVAGSGRARPLLHEGRRFWVNATGLYA